MSTYNVTFGDVISGELKLDEKVKVNVYNAVLMSEILENSMYYIIVITKQRICYTLK